MSQALLPALTVGDAYDLPLKVTYFLSVGAVRRFAELRRRPASSPINARTPATVEATRITGPVTFLLTNCDVPRTVLKVLRASSISGLISFLSKLMRDV